MEAPLLRTKLYISPLRRAIVSRPRLVTQLNAATSRTFTLISAPAGFGKTTLLREWIATQAMEIAWFSIDRGDNELNRFWIYAIAALQTIEPKLGETILAALQTPHPPSIESLLTSLINEISIAEPFSGGRKLILVFDDYHLITESRVHDSLVFFLENSPPQMHLIISSRSNPPWPLARLRARRKMAELRANDLRFTSQEIAPFFQQVMKLDITPQDIAALERRTEGWIVGLQMAALSMQKRSDIPDFVQAFSGTNRFILDYLVEEVLENQPADIQDFLLKSSLFDQLTAPLCDFVLGVSNSQKILSQLEVANLFLVPLDDQRQWFRYHHLFSELLRNQLALTNPVEVLELHQKASQWFEEQDYIDETIAHAFAAHDNERVARLCEKFAPSLLQQSKHSLLSDWIEALPPEIVYRRPWLCVYQSWTRHWAGMREQGEACLENAERLLSTSPRLPKGEYKKLTGSIAAVRAHYCLVNEQLPRAIEQAQNALRLLPDTDFYTASTAEVVLGAAYLGQGDVSKAEEAFLKCASTALKGGFAYRASSALCYAGMQQVKQAKLRLAEKTYQQALSLAQGPGGHQYPAAGYPLAKLSELALEWNHLHQAREWAQKGVKLCQLLGHVDLIAEAYIALARIQLADENFNGLQESLHLVEQLSLQTKLDPWVLGWLAECRVRFWLVTGDVEQASIWAVNSGLDLQEEFSFHHDLHHLNLARVLVAQVLKNSSVANPGKCLGLLERLLAVCANMGWVHHQIQVLILQAQVFQAVKDQKAALSTLHSALCLAEPNGYVHTFIREGSEMAKLFAQFVKCERSNRYASDLLRAFPTDIASQQPGLVEPLSPRELDVLKFLMTSLSVPNIAVELNISVNTVRSHIKNIYGKLGVNRRLDAIQKAKDLNLVS